MINCTLRYIVAITLLLVQVALGQDSVLIPSLNFKTKDLNELRTLDKHINLLTTSQIIFLGEAAHGDGTTLAIKNKLIEYLVASHGFEVVLFERSFYEINKVNSLLKSNLVDQKEAQLLLEAAFKNENFISRELQSTCRFIVSKRYKIDVGGIDLPYRSQLLKLIQPDLMKLGIKKRIASTYVSLLNDLAVEEICSDCETKFDFETFYALSDQIIKGIHALNTDKNNGFTIRTLESNVRLADWIRLRPKIVLKDQESLKKFIHYREKGLYENLLWQLTTLYKGKKIIVSSASFHMTSSEGIETMVNYLPDSIKQVSYFLPFISYQGGTGYDTKQKLFGISEIKPTHSSIESLLHSARYEFSFIDFKSLNEVERMNLSNKLMNPSLVLDSNLNWLKIYDGLFFIDTMKPDYWIELPSTFEKDLRKVISKAKR